VQTPPADAAAPDVAAVATERAAEGAIDAAVPIAPVAKPRPPPAPPAPPTKTHELVESHRLAVRAAVRELGHGDVTLSSDHATDVRDARAVLAAATDPAARALMWFTIGLAERVDGDCIAAKADFNASLGELATLHTTSTGILMAMSRAKFNLALCELETGHALAAERAMTANFKSHLTGATEAEHAEIQLALGIAKWETGDLAAGKELILIAARHGIKLRDRIDVYANAVGLGQGR